MPKKKESTDATSSRRSSARLLALDSKGNPKIPAQSPISPDTGVDALSDIIVLSRASLIGSSAHSTMPNRKFIVAPPMRPVEFDVVKAPARKTRSGETHARTTAEVAGPRSASEYSFKSALGDRSSTYETPATSAFATPAAEPISKGPSTPAQMEYVPAKPKVDPAVRAQELRQSRYALNGGAKRKWEEDSEEETEETPDARLARKLQAQIDAEDLSLGTSTLPTPLRARTRRSRHSEGSSRLAQALTSSLNPDLSSGLSSRLTSLGPSIIDGDSVHDLKFSTPSNRATRSSRASRAAKDSAKKSIAASSSARFEVDDSDDAGVETMDVDSDEYEAEEANDSENDLESSDDERNEPTTGSVEPTVPTAVHRPLASRRQRRTARGTARPRDPESAVNSPVGAARASRGQRVPIIRRPGQPWRRANMTRAEVERAKLEYHHPEILTMWKELEATPVISTVGAVQPRYITRQLKPFQREGLNWMIKQEKTKWAGGLLGDEMGMGKTIQAVSLIMSDYPAMRPTLVVVPPVALMQWQNEIREYTSGKLKVLIYHGTGVKKLTIKELERYDVVMTSYPTLESMYRRQEKGLKRKDEEDDEQTILVKEDSPFHAIQFHRIILDEAHTIKSRQTGTAKACFTLKSDYKWCLSGTPLQNRIGELFSLLRFLEVEPFACYMCKSCSCTQMEWTLDSETRQCTECKHRGFDHISLFNMELLNPITQHGNNGEGAEAFKKLRILMDRIMLRRVKATHATSMELPAKDVGIVNQFFGEVERDFAASIMTNTTRQFDTYVAQGVALDNYANIFGLIMQMRQVANHPDIILKKNAEGGQNVLVCCICDDPAEDAIRSACRHDFCRACVKSYMRSCSDVGNVPGCPRCHIPLAIDLDQEEREQDEEAIKKSSIINRIRMENWTSSTKIETLMYELMMTRRMKCRLKVILFSQFTSMLQLVEWRLRRAGFTTVLLDGTMTPTQRQSSIDFFMKNYDAEIFLVSMKAGGVALNLTEASKVFIIDPWWNPAAEWQSADRCHRIGQGRSCEITRLVIEDSVESRMVLLQEKKTNMIRGTINADMKAINTLTPEDMQFLFRGN